MRDECSRANSIGLPRVVVVGPCASGKTTLVDRLRAEGIDARVSGQEHSEIRNLWTRLTPDLLIALDLDLATLRSRRSPSWPADLFRIQHQRLRGAFAAADLVIDTTSETREEVAEKVLAMVRRFKSS